MSFNFNYLITCEIIDEETVRLNSREFIKDSEIS